MRNVVIGLIAAGALALVLFLSQRGDRSAPAVTADTAASSPAPATEAETALSSAPEREREAAPAASVETTPAPAPVATTIWPRSVVFGRVVDEEGNPAENVKVSLSAVGTEWAAGQDIPVRKTGRYEVQGYEQKTSADGRFRFDVPLPQSDWIALGAEAPIYLGVAGRDFGLAGGRNKPPIKEGDNDVGDIVLSITGAASGEVRSVDGGVVAGAEVRLEGSFPGGYSIQTLCDENGQFVLGHVPEGVFTVGAKANGFLSAVVSSVEIKKRATTPGVVFRLERAPAISGRVVDENGAPLEKVRLWGWPISAGQGAGARSKKDGTFTIYLPQNEPYKLEVQGDEFEPWGGHGSDKTFDPGTSDVLVSLKRLSRTTFVVVDKKSGAPIERFGIVVDDRPQTDGSFRGGMRAPEPKVHEKGECTMIGDPARHLVRVIAAGYQDFEADVKHDDPAAARQTLRLVTGAAFTGRVSHAGQPVAGASLKLERDSIKVDPSKPDDPDDFFNTNYTYDLSEFFGRARMHAAATDGTLRIADLPPGTYRLTVVGGKGAPKVLTGLRLEAGATRDLGEIDLPAAATVKGRVVFGPGHSPADIELHLDEDWSARHTLTNATGVFTFENVPAGAHVLHLRSNQGAQLDEQVAFEVVPNETKELVVDLSAKAPCKVRVRVTRGGRPLQDVAVALEVTQGENVTNQIELGVTGVDGVAVGSVAGGSSGKLCVRSENQLVLARSAAPVELVAGALYETELVVRSGEIVVQFPATLVVPDVGAFMVFLSGGPEGVNTSQFLHCSTAHSPFRMTKLVWKEPRCSLGDIAVGEYTINVNLQFLTEDTPPEGAPVKPFSGKITVEEGKTTVVEIPK